MVLKDQNESLVVLDKKSGGRTLLLESNESLDHFTQDEGKVLVVTSDDKKFVIENITK